MRWRAHIRRADCLRVGEIAAPRNGQASATLMQGPGVDQVWPNGKKIENGNSVYFVPTSIREQARGQWVGTNAFGATASSKTAM
jgi:hypothetical protein